MFFHLHQKSKPVESQIIYFFPPFPPPPLARIWLSQHIYSDMISVRLTEYKIPEGKDEDKVRFDLAELGNLSDWSGWAFYRIA